MSEFPIDELSINVIKLRRRYPQLHRAQAWKIAIDEYEKRIRQMKK
jgi:hypothetical protein